VDGNQTFNVNLSLPNLSTLGVTNTLGGVPIPIGLALGQDTATITIVDNDVANGTIGLITGGLYTAFENGGSIPITVLRTNGSSGTVTISYLTSQGPTPNGAVPVVNGLGDFVPTNGTLTFVDGQTNSTFFVQVIDNSTNNPTHTVTLTLFNPTGGATTNNAVLPINGTLSILDNEVANVPFGNADPAFGPGSGRMETFLRWRGSVRRRLEVSIANK